jgi:hypothetical protein
VDRERITRRSANTYLAYAFSSVCPPSYPNDRESHRFPPTPAGTATTGQEQDEEGKKRRKEKGGKKIACSFKPDVSLQFQNGADIQGGARGTSAPRGKKNSGRELTSKSERTAADHAAPLGVGARDVVGRVAASVGELDAVAPDFQMT